MRVKFREIFTFLKLLSAKMNDVNSAKSLDIKKDTSAESPALHHCSIAGVITMTLKLYVAFSVAAPGGTTQTSLLRDAFAGRRATSRVKPLCTRPARMCETPVAPAKEASKGAVDNARVALGPVFVAGANGRVGQRIVRLLAEAGIPVRAAVRTKSKVCKQSLFRHCFILIVTADASYFEYTRRNFPFLS